MIRRPFLYQITEPSQAIFILKKCAIIFIIAGILEILIGLLVMRHVLFPGILNLILGLLLYFFQTYSLGFTLFIWPLVPLIGAFTNGWGVNFQESCYAILTLSLALIGTAIFLVSLRLNRLLYPPEVSEEDEETKLSD